MLDLPKFLLVSALLLATPLAAQEGEIFIPNASNSNALDPTTQSDAVPENRLAACLVDVNTQNCTGVDLDPSGLELESFADAPDITFETLTLDLGNGHVSTSAAPPVQKPDYTAQPKTYGTVALPAVAITIQFDFDSAAVRYDQEGKNGQPRNRIQGSSASGNTLCNYWSHGCLWVV